MNTKDQDNLLDKLLSTVKDSTDIESLTTQLYKRGVQTLLKAELEAHLGYAKGSQPIGSNLRNGTSRKTLKTPQGRIEIEVPRDREGSFDPITIPKHKTMHEKLETNMLLLYAKGMSNSDIIDYIEKSYGVQYSTSQVSVITNSLMSDIKEWQERPLEDRYAVVWIDAIHYKIRHEGRVISKAAMIVLGIGMDGIQDILSVFIVENESATSWMQILDNLKSRGVEDIIFLCSDNLSGLENAIEAVYPESIRQICIVHQIRNSLKYVSYKDRKSVIKSIKEIYKADNEKMALMGLENFEKKWGHKYSAAVKSWKENWNNLTAFLHYPAEIRKLIYTTNIIESFNASLRKYTRNKKVFPNDDSALKSIYLAAMQIQPRWNKKRAGWSQVYNQLFIIFGNRIS